MLYKFFHHQRPNAVLPTEIQAQLKSHKNDKIKMQEKRIRR